MNTAGLEWFGPPERNTLRSLCVVLLVLSLAFESVESVSQCEASAPLYISREARTWSLSPRQMGPTMLYKITYCTDIMALQATEILFLDFHALLVGIFRQA